MMERSRNAMEREAFETWFSRPEAFRAGDRDGWRGVGFAAWMARAALNTGAEKCFKCGHAAHSDLCVSVAPGADHSGEGAEMVATGKQSLQVDPSASAQKPVATVRVTHGGYGMELSTYVAYALPEGKHDVYAAPSASAQQAALQGRATLFGIAVVMAKELGYDNLTDAFDALRAFKSAAPAPSASPAPVVLYGGGDTPISFEDDAVSDTAAQIARFSLGDVRKVDTDIIESHIRALLAAQTPAAAEADKRDAERYRWLRDDNAFVPEESCIRGGEELDELCDAGIRAGKEGESNA